jgi:hypothetical protein
MNNEDVLQIMQELVEYANKNFYEITYVEIDYYKTQVNAKLVNIHNEVFNLHYNGATWIAK